MKKNMLLKAGSVVIALVVWQIVSMAVGMEMLLNLMINFIISPNPWDTDG